MPKRMDRRTTINAYGFYLMKAKGWMASHFLRWSIVLRPEIFHAFIQEHAGELALRGTLGFLEREGLVHCAKCPSRGQMRRVGNVYACPKHVDEVTAAVIGRGATTRQAVPA
jgi:hypothetical protein